MMWSNVGEADVKVGRNEEEHTTSQTKPRGHDIAETCVAHSQKPSDRTFRRAQWASPKSKSFVQEKIGGMRSLKGL